MTATATTTTTDTTALEKAEAMLANLDHALLRLKARASNSKTSEHLSAILGPTPQPRMGA